MCASLRCAGASPLSGCPTSNDHTVPPKTSVCTRLPRLERAHTPHATCSQRSLYALSVLARSLPCGLDDTPVVSPTEIYGDLRSSPCGQPSHACTPLILQRTPSGGDEYLKIWLVVFWSVRGHGIHSILTNFLRPLPVWHRKECRKPRRVSSMPTFHPV